MPSRDARHVTVAISGFLSQEDDKRSAWSKLADQVQAAGGSLYDYHWDSQVMESLCDTIKKSLQTTAYDGILNFLFG